jgi:hypothetical protein
MIVDLVHDVKGDPGAGLAIGAGVRTHRVTFFSGEFAARESHDLADGFPAGACGRLHLIKEAPKNHLERKEALAAVLPRGPGSQKGSRKGGPEKLAKLGQRRALRKLGQSLRQTRDRRFAKKQRAESAKKRSGCRHAM